MSQDDEIERLLREVDALNSGGAPRTPATMPGSTPSPASGGGGAAVRTGLVAGVVCAAGVGTATFLLQWLPFVDNPFSSAAGAFVGAFLTGTVVSWRRKG